MARRFVYRAFQPAPFEKDMCGAEHTTLPLARSIRWFRCGSKEKNHDPNEEVACRDCRVPVAARRSSVFLRLESRSAVYCAQSDQFDGQKLCDQRRSGRAFFAAAAIGSAHV